MNTFRGNQNYGRNGAINMKRSNNFNRNSPQVSKRNKVEKVFNNKLKLFITNIPNDGDAVKSQIRALVSNYGDIVYERYFSRRRGQGMTHAAFMVMKNEAAVKQALALHGSLVDDRHIIVSAHGQYVAHPNCVYVSNLQSDITEEDLWTLFGSKGNILFVHIKNAVNLNTSDVPLDAEVIFETLDAAKNALSLDGSELKGRRINVTASPRERIENHSELSVHVSGLPQDVTKEKLVSFFPVTSGAVRMVKINFNKLTAVVHFTSLDGVKSALKLDGKYLGNHALVISQREEEVLNLNFENPAYLFNIPESVKDVDLFLAFQDCGHINEIRFLARRTSTTNKRAVIQFKHPESIAKAVLLDGIVLGDERIRVSNSEKLVSTSNGVNGCGSGKVYRGGCTEKTSKKRSVTSDSGNWSNQSEESLEDTEEESLEDREESVSMTKKIKRK